MYHICMHAHVYFKFIDFLARLIEILNIETPDVADDASDVVPLEL